MRCVTTAGTESAAIVEYAPLQKLSHRSGSPKHRDHRMATIEQDADYTNFLQMLLNPEPPNVQGTEKMLEDIDAPTGLFIH